MLFVHEAGDASPTDQTSQDARASSLSPMTRNREGLRAMRPRKMGALLRAAPIMALVLGAGFGVVPVEAKSPPAFSGVTAAASDQHDVGVSFTETGLRPAQLVTEQLRGKATDTYGCYGGDGQLVATAALIEHPSLQQQYQASDGGTIDQAGIAISVLPLDACPGGRKSYLFKTVFDHLRLTDLTSHLSVDVPGSFTSCSPADCLPPPILP